ncbi:MAG: T9SS type A sorting domain-containing protein [Cyclobacteriaceae bacterium]
MMIKVNKKNRVVIIVALLLATMEAYGQGVTVSGVAVKASGPVSLKIVGDGGNLNIKNSGLVAIGTESTLSLSGDLNNQGEIVLNGNFAIAGSRIQKIQSSTIISIGNMSINNGNGAVLQSAILVIGNLTLTNGTITTTPQNLLTLDSRKSFSSGKSSSYINGPLAIKTSAEAGSNYSFHFPVGNESKYQPINLTFTQTNTQSTTYLIILNSENIPSYSLSDDLKGVSSARYWNINNGDVSNFQDAEITLPVGSDDIEDISEAVIAKSNSNQWQSLGGKINSSSSTVSSTVDFSNLGDFIVASRQEPVTPPSFTLSPSSVEVNENFTDVQTVTINPADNTPAASYSFSPELSTINLAKVSYDASSRQISIAPVTNANGSVSIDITAQDQTNASNAAEQTLEITINGVNDPPTIVNPLASVFVSQDAEPKEIDVSDVFADIDGDDLMYAAESDDPTLVTTQLDGTNLTLNFASGKIGDVTITLTASDGIAEPVSHTFEVSIRAIGENLPPTAKAGQDQRVTDADNDESEEIMLDGSASDDPDGEIVSYGWSENGEPLPGGTGAQPTVNLNVGVHIIVLTVADNDGAISTDTVTITVVTPDTPGPLGEDQVSPDILTELFSESFEINGSQNLSLGVVATDDRQIDISTSTYRYAGITQNFETEAKTLEVTSSETDTYAVSLAQSDLIALDPLGIQYQFIIQDTSANEAPSSIGKTYWKYDITMPTQKPLVAEPKQTNYQLVAIPFNQQAVTSAWPGLNYNKEDIRLFRHNPSKPIDNSYEEYESAGFTSFEPGRGYWLLAKPTMLNNVQGEVVPPNAEGNVSIEVETGWNLIGNPYPFAINWNEVRNFQENNNLLQNSGIIKFFRTSEYSTDDVTEINPYEGFFVNISSPGTLLFPMQALASSSGRIGTISKKLSDLDEANWRVSLTLTASDSSQQNLKLGMHPNGTLGRDYYDADVFPGFFTNSGIAFQRADFQFSTDIIPSATFAEWSIQIPEDKDAERYSLRWNNQSLQSSQYQLWLFNPSTSQIINLKEKSSYYFQSSTHAQNLKILYGTQSEVLEYLAPEQLVIGKVYPNPASQVIRIPIMVPENDEETIQLRMLDVMGKIVQVNSQTIHAGVHEILGQIDTKPGVYYLQILSEEDEVICSQKIIITSYSYE